MSIWKYGFGLGQGGTNLIRDISDAKLVNRVAKLDYDIRDMLVFDGDQIILDRNGAGGDSHKGAEYFKDIEKEVRYYISQNISNTDNNQNKLLVCAGGGNGTGDGSIMPFIKICSELKIKPFVIFTLPIVDVEGAEGLEPRKNALERLVSIINYCINDVSGLLIIDNDFIKKRQIQSGINLTGYTSINKLLTSSLTYFTKLTLDKNADFVSSYKIFDFNDFVNLLTDYGVVNMYELNLSDIDINDLTDYVNKNIGKSSLFSDNMNLNTVRSGVALVNLPSYFSSTKVDTTLTNIYKGISNRFKLSKKFIYTSVKSNVDSITLKLLVTGMTLTQKVSVDVKHLQNSIKRFKSKHTDDKLNVDFNFDI